MADNVAEIQDHASALAFLFSRINYERVPMTPYGSRQFKLDRMRRLVQRVGNPERAFPAIHIAGTKGKGSTAVMVAAALAAAGYRTGLYTSPHFERLEERLVVDGRPCAEEELVALVAHLHPVVAELDREADAAGDWQGPTFFEITTAAALLHFQRRQVDCAVLEVGLGGRLDSTNVCHSALSMVTSISFDHMQQLGTTLTSIAREKAGIIKPAVPVVTGVTEEEPLAVIRQLALQNGSRLLELGRDFRFAHRPGRSGIAGPLAASNLGNGLDYEEEVDGGRLELRDVRIGLLGRHQAANASVALASLQQLRRDGWRLNEGAIRRGLSEAYCPARIEIVSDWPVTVLDAAHNPASIGALLDTLNQLFDRRPRVLVFAASFDKDTRGMLDLLLPQFEHVILTRYLNSPRAADPAELTAMSSSIKADRDLSRLRLHARPDPCSAWQLVEQLVSPAHLICVTGSFFLAAEMRPFSTKAAGRSSARHGPDQAAVPRCDGK